ncbi:MAG: pyruvate/2-oxoglutarate dehydrogenase complex, dihydrolipoamide dehydrogenase-like component [halophilic archaeon J07HX64]|jgi:Pyruvate/2-oxoglutarate dehydrogenase complex, dihydrolipoamide dehydrogenase (E3) component, and related enzymes|nr:MAG: pyruvate/2-oxoglutarate dehydrogenase complex, dihydrolipoamide dehydrogenase-like component [halophilic archaeon J07HX64]
MTDEYDLLVVGGGTGNNVAAAAADAGMETALVEKGSLGGTCLNRGCNPSKMVIQAANAANGVRDAGRFHLDSSLDGHDFGAIIEEMDETLSGIAAGMESRYREKSNLTLYNAEAEFVDERTVTVDGERVRGEQVVLAAGSRPLVPPIDGLDSVDFLTSRDALYLREQPDSLVVLGGGYIAVELGYFFESLGTDVAIVEMEEQLVPREDPEVAEAFTGVARERHDVFTGYRARSVEGNPDGSVAVHAEGKDGDTVTVSGSELLVAVGRRPNTDSLGIEETGVETDERGFVETDRYLGTTADGVWALGDIAGNHMFKHSGDYETDRLVQTVVEDDPAPVDYTAMPHAIFTEPQIAGVGDTEDELREADREYSVGRQSIPETPMGRAKKLDHGFVKLLAAPDDEILGCHIFGHEASVLLHEVVVAMRNASGTVEDIAGTIHAHPTLNKAVEYAFQDAQ